VMPQTYSHGGNETTVTPYYNILNSYQKIVYGLSGEGYKAPSDYEPDNPAQYARGVKNNGAADFFRGAWTPTPCARNRRRASRKVTTSSRHSTSPTGCGT